MEGIAGQTSWAPRHHGGNDAANADACKRPAWLVQHTPTLSQTPNTHPISMLMLPKASGKSLWIYGGMKVHAAGAQNQVSNSAG